MRLTRGILLSTTVFGFALGVGCSDTAFEGTAPLFGGGGSDGGAGGETSASSGLVGPTGSGGASSSSSGAMAPPTEIATCQGKTYACGDLMDNDGDGLVDSQDPDCLGPCDNTESSFFGGIPGQSGPACMVDCYFDQDSGSGNDDCHWNHQCDPHEVAPGYHPESESGALCAYNAGASTPGAQKKTCDELDESQSQRCHDICGPLTPNGCDCFGCCELPAGSGSYVWLGSDADGTGEGSCTMADLTDPSRCEPCQPVAACLNTCGRCELCIGKDTLPADCLPSGGAGGAGGATAGTEVQCPEGIEPCGVPGQSACLLGFACVSGCCQETPR